LGRRIWLWTIKKDNEIKNYINGYIDEGQFSNEGTLTGFGRKIFEGGDYRIGWFKDQAMFGYGKKIYRKGMNMEGLFMNGHKYEGKEATGKAAQPILWSKYIIKTPDYDTGEGILASIYRIFKDIDFHG